MDKFGGAWEESTAPLDTHGTAFLRPRGEADDFNLLLKESLETMNIFKN